MFVCKSHLGLEECTYHNNHFYGRERHWALCLPARSRIKLYVIQVEASAGLSMALGNISHVGQDFFLLPVALRNFHYRRLEDVRLAIIRRESEGERARRGGGLLTSCAGCPGFAIEISREAFVQPPVPTRHCLD